MIPRDEAMQCCYQIPGMLWPSEQGWLYDMMAGSKSHCEVGVYAGKSLFASTAGMRSTCKVVAVDSFVGAGPMSRDWLLEVTQATIAQIHARTNARVTLVKRGSIDAARDNKVLFDSVWIDACHEYAECKADIETWSAFVKPSGFICGHDYWARDAGVMDAVNETGEFSVPSGTRIWWRRL